MRVIETRMNNAIRKRQNFSNSNTTVKTTSFFDNDVYCEESKVFHLCYEEANEYYGRKAGYRQGSVTAFIDKNTGEVYKPASWKAPAKHVRYDLRIIREREFLLNPKN